MNVRINDRNQSNTPTSIQDLERRGGMLEVYNLTNFVNKIVLARFKGPPFF